MLDVRMLIVVALACLSLTGGGAFGQTVGAPADKAVEARLRGLNAAEAAALIGELKTAQAAMRRGDRVFFELMSGAPASYDMAKTSPRDAFLGVDFDKTWEVQRLAPENPNWRPHRLTVTPEGLGKLLWDMKVVVGVTGRLEQVEMFYRAPHPF